MEQDKEEEQLCTNCKYFLRHYVNYCGHFETVKCGHCMKHIGLRLDKMIKHKTPCELWERTEIAAKREKHVKADINKLINLLEDYVQILKLEK